MWEITLFTVLAVVLVVIAIAWRPWRDSVRRRRVAAAQEEFLRSRGQFEEDFFAKAFRSGKPRGLRWKACDFEDEVTFAQEKARPVLVALVGVTISFEAVEGGPMEDVEAVGNLRTATAVFKHTDAGWQTDGRALFNLEPADAIQRYGGELETVNEESPSDG